MPQFIHDLDDDCIRWEEEAREFLDEQPPEIQNELAEAEASYLEDLEEESKLIERHKARRRAEAQAVRNRFRTINELYNSQYKDVRWLVPGILPNESLICIQGRPKCGKSTFVFAMLNALLEGGRFLGNLVQSGKVV